MKTISRLAALILIASSFSALADIEAITVEGKSVMLKSDHTWEYTKTEDSDARRAILSVVLVDSGNNYCRIGLKLQNDLADKITSIVFRFSAYTEDEVRFDTISRGYQHIKPTNQDYKEITFSGLSCKQIKYVRVHGADRCNIGELNKFSMDKGVCLGLVNVEPSNKIVILKRYQDISESESNPETDNVDIDMEEHQGDSDMDSIDLNIEDKLDL